jgi:hypothetical protein
MKALLLLIIFSTLASLYAEAQTRAQVQAEESWSLVSVFNASSHIFYGEITKIIPEPNFPTGALGVNIEEIEGSESDAFELKAIVWPRAQEFTFSVQESFKEPMADTFAAYRADPELNLWTYVENEAGDVFLAKPEAVSPMLKGLVPRQSGLFFIRDYLGSNLRIIYRARLGQNALDDLALLRAYQAVGDASLESIILQARARDKAQAKLEAEAFRVFEDDYYKILRIQELDIRSSLLSDLIVKMGFEGRWTYFGYKERYIKNHGSHVDGKEIPAPPFESREKLWQDVSSELKKIEMILKARE